MLAELVGSYTRYSTRRAHSETRMFRYLGRTPIEVTAGRNGMHVLISADVMEEDEIFDNPLFADFEERGISTNDHRIENFMRFEEYDRWCLGIRKLGCYSEASACSFICNG